MKRTFVAVPIDLPDFFYPLFEELKQSLRNEQIKWVHTRRMHITLFFSGSTSSEMEAKIKNSTRKIAAQFKPGILEFNKLGVFPSLRNPRVLWMGLKDVQDLNSIYTGLIEELTKLGIAVPNEKAFIPHLTLGRIKWMKDVSGLSDLLEVYSHKISMDININRLVYYQSNLTPEGPIYKVIGEYYLV